MSGLNQELVGRVRYVASYTGEGFGQSKWIEIILSPGGWPRSILDGILCMLCMYVQPSIYYIINGKYHSFGHFL